MQEQFIPIQVPRTDTCPVCNGWRFIERRQPQIASRTITVDPDTGYAKWPCDGGVPKRVAYPTGKTINFRFQCEACHGTGRRVAA